MSPNRENIVDPNLVEKAKDCVDFISSKTPLNKVDVTQNFATNLVELTDSAL